MSQVPHVAGSGLRSHWLLARDINSFPCSLSTGQLITWQLASSRARSQRERERGEVAKMEATVFCNINSRSVMS